MPGIMQAKRAELCNCLDRVPAGEAVRACAFGVIREQVAIWFAEVVRAAAEITPPDIEHVPPAPVGECG